MISIYLIVQGDKEESPSYFAVLDKKEAIKEAYRYLEHSVDSEEFVDLLEINPETAEVRQINFEYDSEGVFEEGELEEFFDELGSEDD